MSERPRDNEANHPGRSGQVKSRQILLVAAASTVLAFSGCGALDRDAVQNEVARAASTASEGMLVARQAKRDRTWRSFTEIRTAELHGAAQQSEQKLTQPTEQGLGGPAEQASKLAAHVRAALGSLHDHPDDARLAASVERKLSGLSHDLDRIEHRL
jgi:hypothetical protein